MRAATSSLRRRPSESRERPLRAQGDEDILIACGTEYIGQPLSCLAKHLETCVWKYFLELAERRAQTPQHNAHLMDGLGTIRIKQRRPIIEKLTERIADDHGDRVLDRRRGLKPRRDGPHLGSGFASRQLIASLRLLQRAQNQAGVRQLRRQCEERRGLARLQFKFALGDWRAVLPCNDFTVINSDFDERLAKAQHPYAPSNPRLKPRNQVLAVAGRDYP